MQELWKSFTSDRPIPDNEITLPFRIVCGRKEGTEDSGEAPSGRGNDRADKGSSSESPRE